jgi:hypothetical protein
MDGRKTLSSLLTFLRPIPLSGVQRVLIVQTGLGSRLPRLIDRSRGLFGDARLEVLLREGDASLREEIDVASTRVARWEERYSLLPELRRSPYDVVVLQVGGATTELRLLPFLLRTRSIVSFDEALEARAVTLFRLPGLIANLGLLGEDRTRFEMVRRALAKITVVPVVSLLSIFFLLGSNAWLRLRPSWRRQARRE